MRTVAIVILVIGCVMWRYYTYYSALWQFPQRARAELVIGRIASIPECAHRGCRFRLTLRAYPIGTVAVRWYGRVPHLVAGSVWQLHLRYYASHQLSARQRHWRYGQGVLGMAVVVPDHRNQPCEAGGEVWLRWRQRIEESIAATIDQPALAAIISALTVGSRGLMQPSVWRVFTRTGTGHLVAISGLHVGLVALAAYRVIWRVVCCWPGLLARWPAGCWAGLGAWLVALVYALLAGMSLPTQRALLMLSALYLPQCVHRHWPFWWRLMLAFMVIIAVEPGAIWQAGCWLSFMAVSWIAFVMRARLQYRPEWQQALLVHAAVTIGLLPLSLFFFQQVSVIAPLANALAVPWMTFVIVPVALLGVILMPCYWPLAKGMLLVAAWLLQPLWWYLQQLSSNGQASMTVHALSPVQFIAGMVGAGLLLLPRGMPGKWLGIVLLLSMFLPPVQL